VSALAHEAIEVSVYDRNTLFGTTPRPSELTALPQQSCAAAEPVLDVRLPGRDDLIGQFHFDATSLYLSKDHTLHRQWVALAAPYAKRKYMLGGAAAGGVTGQGSHSGRTSHAIL
jgi:hypothetical protein